MFHALGSFAYRRRWAIIALWILVILAGTPLVPGATERLQFGGFTSPRMESVRAQELMRRELPVRGSSLVVLFTSPTLTADDPQFNRQVVYAMAGLQGAPEVDQVIPYSSNPRQISGDRRTVYELVVLKASDEEAAREIGAVTARLRDPGEASVGRPELTTEPQRAQRGPAEADRVFGDVGKGLVPFRTVAADGGSSGTSPDATPVRRTVSAETPGGGAQGPALQSAGGSQVRMLVTGGPVLFSEVERLSAEDLRRAEIVAFPFAALALLAVFGSIVATGLPIALGGASVVGILAAVALMSRAMDLSIFVVNVATMLGLGLGVDYSLFMVSRFREELERRPVGEAVAATVATAGKAVFFSGLSVFIGLLGLTTFEFNMLHSVGLVGMVGIVLCVVAALTLLPAIMGVLGPNVNRWRVPLAQVGVRGFWERSAEWVMRHPVLVFLPTLTLLVALGLPFLEVRFSAPDATILPPHLESRQALDLLRREFGESETAPVLAVVRFDGRVTDPENISRLYDLSHALARDPRVSEVESIVDLDPRLTKEQYGLIFADPSRIADPYAQRIAAVTTSERVTLVEISTRTAPVSEEAKGFVRDLRAVELPEGMSLLVGGTSANVIDVVEILYADAPRALAFVVVAIYLVLLLLFRSVLLPAKAIVMNTLSILASYGALVWVFQEGHFQQQLRFESNGTTEASMPIIMFCILFGLSMDYEVFLLARIREEYEKTGDNRASVAKGMERSGKIITSAAIIVVVVGGAFAAAEIMTIKALGLGIAIAVFLDATVVRSLLVPATMRLLGDWNWWAPGWLLRLLPRLGDES